MSNPKFRELELQEEIQIVAERKAPEEALEEAFRGRTANDNSANLSVEKAGWNGNTSIKCRSIVDGLNSKDDAQKLLKDLPLDDFLNFLEQSSPEQLESFLNQLAPSKQPVTQPLRSLFSMLVSIPDEPRGAFSVIAWWEARRVLFNTVVLVCGLPTLAIIYFAGLASLKFTVTGAIEYAILANICYSFGCICELVARSWWKERARHLAPILLTLGLAFSVLLTIGAGFVMVVLFALLSVLR